MATALEASNIDLPSPVVIPTISPLAGVFSPAWISNHRNSGHHTSRLLPSQSSQRPRHIHILLVSHHAQCRALRVLRTCRGARISNIAFFVFSLPLQWGRFVVSTVVFSFQWAKGGNLPLPLPCQNGAISFAFHDFCFIFTTFILISLQWGAILPGPPFRQYTAAPTSICAGPAVLADNMQ